MSYVIFLMFFSLFWKSVLQFWPILWVCLSGMLSFSVGMLFCSLFSFLYYSDFDCDLKWIFFCSSFLSKISFSDLERVIHSGFSPWIFHRASSSIVLASCCFPRFPDSLVPSPNFYLNLLFSSLPLSLSCSYLILLPTVSSQNWALFLKEKLVGWFPVYT